MPGEPFGLVDNRLSTRSCKGHIFNEIKHPRSFLVCVQWPGRTVIFVVLPKFSQRPSDTGSCVGVSNTPSTTLPPKSVHIKRYQKHKELVAKLRSLNGDVFVPLPLHSKSKIWRGPRGCCASEMVSAPEARTLHVNKSKFERFHPCFFWLH